MKSIEYRVLIQKEENKIKIIKTLYRQDRKSSLNTHKSRKKTTHGHKRTIGTYITQKQIKSEYCSPIKLAGKCNVRN